MKIIYQKYFSGKRTFYSGIITACLICLSQLSFAQTLDFFKGSDCTIATSNDVSAGCTSTNYIQVQYQNFPQGGLNLPAGWTLKVQANGDFSNGTATIPSQYVSIG